MPSLVYVAFSLLGGCTVALLCLVYHAFSGPVSVLRLFIACLIAMILAAMPIPVGFGLYHHQASLRTWTVICYICLDALSVAQVITQAGLWRVLQNLRLQHGSHFAGIRHSGILRRLGCPIIWTIPVLAALVPCIVSLALNGDNRPLVVGLVFHSLWPFALVLIWLIPSNLSFRWMAGLAVELLLGITPVCTVVLLFKSKEMVFLFCLAVSILARVINRSSSTFDPIPVDATPSTSNLVDGPPLDSLTIGVFGSGAQKWLTSHPSNILDVTVSKTSYKVVTVAEPMRTQMHGCIFLLPNRITGQDSRKLEELDKLSKPMIVLTDENKTDLEKIWTTTDDDKEVWGLVIKAIVSQLGRRDISEFDTTIPVNTG
ncbi:hypothetical protein EDB80DRAFT_258174 [Ilyonectria destructans]|nr:hypothetical protein EDB80DRAFT_258174 [Ilyonectria destructans]